MSGRPQPLNVRSAPVPALAELQSKGWTIVPSVVPAGLIDDLVAQLDHSLVLRDSIRRENGVEGANDGTLHHLIGDHSSFVSLLGSYEQVDPLLQAFFGGKYILNSYGGVINRRDTSAYVHQVHRDIRFSSDTKKFMLNTLVMLDDFSGENGATYLLSGSHRSSEQPEQATFMADADRAIGYRGSILFFDSQLWHAAGANQTDRPRRALTLTFTNPFFKQQLDYPRLLGYSLGDRFSPFLRQLIGYNARVPATLNEYYVAVSKRFYQRGQDE